jgi:hypothetical protein
MIGQSSLTKLNTLRGCGNYIPKRGQGNYGYCKIQPGLLEVNCPRPPSSTPWVGSLPPSAGLLLSDAASKGAGSGIQCNTGRNRGVGLCRTWEHVIKSTKKNTRRLTMSESKAIRQGVRKLI